MTDRMDLHLEIRYVLALPDTKYEDKDLKKP